MNWYTTVLKKYAVFEGRARRTEYWMFALFNFIIYVVLLTLSLITHSIAFIVLMYVYGFAVLIPGLAVMVRRLHDTNRSGWWIFISFVPLVGGIIMLVFSLMDSYPGTNQWGPNPKVGTTGAGAVQSST